MPVTRINRFTSKPGSEDALHDLLQSILPIIEGSNGSISAKVLRGVDAPSDLIVVEQWEDVASHQASAQAIPPDLLSKAMALMAGPPEGDYYE